jgi:hypothetical protein
MWMRFETEPDFGFDFYLAEKLHMPVALMRQRVSAEEYMAWGVYYGRKAQAAEMARLRGR